MIPMMHPFLLCLFALLGGNVPFSKALITAGLPRHTQKMLGCRGGSSSSSSESEGDATREMLEKKLSNILDDLDALPVVMSRQQGNIEVRTKWEGDCMLSVGEAKVVDHHPSEFKGFFEDFSQAFPKVNAMAKRVTALEGDNTEKEALKSVLQFPFPLKDRIMIHWKYTILDRGQDEHLLLISEEDNDGIMRKHLSPEDKEKYVLARTFLCAYLVKPVYDKEKIIGSNIKYIFSGDTGGKIPQWVQNAVGPKTAFDSVKGLIDYVKKGAGGTN